MMQLESSQFGTHLLVINSFRLVKWSVDNLLEAFSDVKEGFDSEYTQRWLIHFMDDGIHEELLLAVRLNPYQMIQPSLTAEEIAQTDAIIASKIAAIQNSQNTPSSSQTTDTSSQDGSVFQYGFTFTHFRDTQ
ncbi:hypothetical protein TRFO_43210 [Tritrichomonas foetus]|uniref:Uncharacterized protein n=1 Tax=Tritrichomonas foetus TaxID=1144522 RepID=A0A1J4KW10_9EUKA|nr:hypothetical protein TRFO_43210 [Tritrichomonas foetus]|eukprot:OHT13940.1 hypothetical protein TRFO_43210 [Tritrichomonas foetus]